MKKKKCCEYSPGCVFTILHLLRNLGTDPISRVFDTGKPLQLCYRTVQLIGPILNLRRKWSVVNKVPDPEIRNINDYFVTLFKLVKFSEQMPQKCLPKCL